jgi:hypothetical protein
MRQGEDDDRVDAGGEGDEDWDAEGIEHPKLTTAENSHRESPAPSALAVAQEAQCADQFGGDEEEGEESRDAVDGEEYPLESRRHGRWRSASGPRRSRGGGCGRLANDEIHEHHETSHGETVEKIDAAGDKAEDAGESDEGWRIAARGRRFIGDIDRNWENWLARWRRFWRQLAHRVLLGKVQRAKSPGGGAFELCRKVRVSVMQIMTRV